MTEGIIRVLIDIFIVVMIFWMVFWDSEVTNPIRKYWIPKLTPAFIWLGLTAEWKMFSPDPPLRNIWPKIKITMNDGNFVVWEPMALTNMSAFEKIRYKKFHKVYFEVARPKTAFHTKRDFIEYLLDKYSFKETCIKAEVYMICQAIPPFNAQAAPAPEIYQQLIFTFHPNK